MWSAVLSSWKPSSSGVGSGRCFMQLYQNEEKPLSSRGAQGEQKQIKDWRWMDSRMSCGRVFRIFRSPSSEDES